METAESTTSSERPGRSSNGWPVLAAALVAAALASALIVWAAVEINVPLIVVGSVVAVIAVVALAGLILVEPNEARVLQLLGGSYAGTLREPGLRWMNPLNSRRKISTRIRNHETARAKVNDADGNPIDISHSFGSNNRMHLNYTIFFIC